ncbi:MAG: hypothetical protein JWM00_318 [Candidatus Saccharibacteria bacterium]|nr:hypothetical protein [Candidatus Saccharibacteria bacterium]
MGFWRSIGKIIAGKPMDEGVSVSDKLYASGSEGVKSDEESPSKVTFIDSNGNKIVPEVSFKHFKSHIDGSQVKTWAWAVNDSPFELELVKTELLGHHQDIHRRLRPQESHEVMVYAGPTITNDHDHHAHLYYKIYENSDNFLAEYAVEFNRESNGTFTLEQFHRTYQPRDV